MTGLKDDIVWALQEDVKKGLKANLTAINTASENLKIQAEKNKKTMKENLVDYKAHQKSFFEMLGVREVIFWVGQAATVVSLVLLIYFLFFS